MSTALRRIHSSYLGQKVFPKEMTEFEIREFFSLSNDDKRAIRIGSPSKTRLPLALQLGFLRMTGTTLDACDYVPRPVLEFLGKQLKVRAPMLATLRALYGRRMTRFRHQRWACRYLGVVRLNKSGERTLIESVALETTVTVDRDQLTLRAHEMMYERRIRIPSRRSMERLVRQAIREVEATDIKAVHAVIPPVELQRWYERLVHSEVDGMSALEWIRRAPRQRGLKTRTLALRKLEYLRCNFSALARSSLPIPPERLRAYARRLHRRRLDHAKEVTEPGRTLEVVGFLFAMLGRQADRVLRMVEMAIARLWRQAHEQALDEPVRPNNVDSLISVLSVRANDESITDAEYREFAREYLKTWSAQLHWPCRAARIRQLLVDKEPRVRALMREILALRLEGPSRDPVLRALINIKDCYGFPPPALFDNAELPFTPVWQPIVDDPDRLRVSRFRSSRTKILW